MMALPQPNNANATCFAEGTYILTIHGNATIETLQVGDLVKTVPGDFKPVKWIGHRKIYFNALPKNEADLNRPVLVSESSLGERVPFRDLVVSQRHIVAHGDRAYMAGSLVNNTTIRFLDEVAEITYYHIEFECKEILFANGLMAESYVDCGNRCHFENYLLRAKSSPATGETGQKLLNAVSNKPPVSNSAQLTIQRILSNRGLAQ